jgi:hypothetical protein
MNKVNNSLRAFSNAINALVIIGALFVVIGIVVIASNSGYGASLQAIAFAVGLIYLGSGSIGLGIFGSFLRITASSIIEGLGGNLYTGSKPVDGEPAPLPPRNAKPGFSLSKDETEKILGSLYNYQREEWSTAGSPDLGPWVAAGKPDFDEWISSQKR